VSWGELLKTLPLRISIGEGMDMSMDVGSTADFTYTLR
jgi:hypothetical protein